MRLAAALARDPARHTAARAELEHADAWLRRWMAGPEEETAGWGIDPDDVARAARRDTGWTGLAQRSRNYADGGRQSSRN